MEMKVCDMCGDTNIVFGDGDVHFCLKHAKEMGVTPNIDSVTEEST